jgi:hypothetical protein
MSTTPENLPLETIAAALRIAAMGGRELWGYDEIAAYSKYERNYVVNVIAAQPTFPKPVNVLKDTGKKAHPRYIANDVMEWFESRKERG